MQENGRTLQISLWYLHGACQSFYEAIMEAGADFASSPGRILIDFIDPLIVARTVATTDKRVYISAREISKQIKEGEKGISGIGAMGKRKFIADNVIK